MIVKLKKWEDVKKEFDFKKIDSDWEMSTYKGEFWKVSREMILYFGGYIEVEITRDDHYTHYGVRKKKGNSINRCWYWHELWFEEEEFISCEEFSI